VGCIQLEVSVYDDASTDRTWEMLQDWRHKLSSAGIRFTASRNNSLKPRGGKLNIEGAELCQILLYTYLINMVSD
jgi:hypothetical protein